MTRTVTPDCSRLTRSFSTVVSASSYMVMSSVFEVASSMKLSIVGSEAELVLNTKAEYGSVAACAGRAEKVQTAARPAASADLPITRGRMGIRLLQRLCRARG